MDLRDLFKIGAEIIQGNSDDTTSGLDIADIINALENLLSNGNGSIDLAGILTSLSKNGLGEIVGSWLGNGSNKSISSEQTIDLLGSDKITAFATELGLADKSAAYALSEAVPPMVDRATSGEGSILDEMMGGSTDSMEMLSKMFR
jgi:uncharacterized protein YidB (DUF937 family)